MSEMSGEKFDETLTLFRATEKDFYDILDFMFEDFLHSEPLNDSMSATKEDYDEFFRGFLVELCEILKFKCGILDLTKDGILSGYSYIIRDNESNKVIAIRLTTFLERNSEHSEGHPIYSSWKANAILKLLGALESKLWDSIPSNINKLASWTILSVSSKYARRGIALKLIEYDLDELKQVGCQGIATEATAFKSQQLFVKHGYQNLYEILHSDWKNEEGQQIFKCNDSTDRAILIYKEF